MRTNFVILLSCIILLWIGATGFAVTSIKIDSSKKGIENKHMIADINKTGVKDTIDTKLLKADVGELTLFVNGVNNILAAYGVVLAILTFLLAIVGYFSVKPLTDKVTAQEKLIEEKFKLIDSENSKYYKSLDVIKVDFTNKVELIEVIEKRLITQNEYIERSTTYIYDVIYKLAASNKLHGKQLIEKISTDMQILQLFSANKDSRFAALYYLAENGTKSNMEDIRYVSINDLDEEIRCQAFKVLGRIEERDNFLNATMKSSTNQRL